jgi:hypothetical protein
MMRNQPLKSEPDAEDDVVGTRHPQRALGLVDTPDFISR